MKLGHSQANKIYWYKCHQTIYQNQVKEEGAFNTNSYLCSMKLPLFTPRLQGHYIFLENIVSTFQYTLISLSYFCSSWTLRSKFRRKVYNSNKITSLCDINTPIKITSVSSAKILCHSFIVWLVKLDNNVTFLWGSTVLPKTNRGRRHIGAILFCENWEAATVSISTEHIDNTVSWSLAVYSILILIIQEDIFWNKSSSGLLALMFL